MAKRGSGVGFQDIHTTGGGIPVNLSSKPPSDGRRGMGKVLNARAPQKLKDYNPADLDPNVDANQMAPTESCPIRRNNQNGGYCG